MTQQSKKIDISVFKLRYQVQSLVGVIGVGVDPTSKFLIIYVTDKADITKLPTELDGFVVAFVQNPT